ncbi:MAG: hypothetical protein ABIG71_02295 [Candidatus Uhrbacteria bacterium]
MKAVDIIVSKLFPDGKPDFLKTRVGELIMQGGTGALLTALGQSGLGIPKKELVTTVGALILEAFGRDGAEELIDQLAPALAEIANIGESLAQGKATGQLDTPPQAQQTEGAAQPQEETPKIQ